MFQSFILFVSDGPWQIGAMTPDGPALLDVPTAADQSPAAQATAAAKVLKENGYSGGAMLLGLASQWCLCDRIDAHDLPKSGRRQALSYRLEERLPLPVEELAVDFVTSENYAFGVTAQMRMIQPLVEALSAEDIHIDAISPTTLLAVQNEIEKGKLSECDAVLRAGESDGHLELIVLNDRSPAGWQVLAATADDVALQVGLLLIDRPSTLRLVLSGVGSDVRQRLKTMADVQIIDVELPTLRHSATAAADEVVKARLEPWIDLQRAMGDAHSARVLRRPLITLGATALFFIVSVCGAMFWRANHYEQLAAEYELKQEEEFKRALPGRSVPPIVLQRLASEERKIRVNGGASDAPERVDALKSLHQLLVRLPQDESIRYRIFELSFMEENLRLEGNTRSIADADTMTNMLKSGNGFEVSLSGTENLADGEVAFTILGRVPPAAAPAQVPQRATVATNAAAEVTP